MTGHYLLSGDGGGEWQGGGLHEFGCVTKNFT